MEFRAGAVFLEHSIQTESAFRAYWLEGICRLYLDAPSFLKSSSKFHNWPGAEAPSLSHLLSGIKLSTGDSIGGINIFKPAFVGGAGGGGVGGGLIQGKHLADRFSDQEGRPHVRRQCVEGFPSPARQIAG